MIEPKLNAEKVTRKMPCNVLARGIADITDRTFWANVLLLGLGQFNRTLLEKQFFTGQHLVEFGVTQCYVLHDFVTVVVCVVAKIACLKIKTG